MLFPGAAHTAQHEQSPHHKVLVRSKPGEGSQEKLPLDKINIFQAMNQLAPISSVSFTENITD